MTHEEVSQLLGASGEEISHSNVAGYSTTIHTWRGTNGAMITAMFQNDHLLNKSELGLQ